MKTSLIIAIFHGYDYLLMENLLALACYRQLTESGELQKLLGKQIST